MSARMRIFHDAAVNFAARHGGSASTWPDAMFDAFMSYHRTCSLLRGAA